MPPTCTGQCRPAPCWEATLAFSQPSPTPPTGPQVLAFYEKAWWRKEGVPLEEQVTASLEPHAFNPDHPLYIDSVFDVSPPPLGGPGVLASFL